MAKLSANGTEVSRFQKTIRSPFTADDVTTVISVRSNGRVLKRHASEVTRTAWKHVTVAAGLTIEQIEQRLIAKGFARVEG